MAGETNLEIRCTLCCCGIYKSLISCTEHNVWLFNHGASYIFTIYSIYTIVLKLVVEMVEEFLHFSN